MSDADATKPEGAAPGVVDSTADLTLEAFIDIACPWSYVSFNRAREAAMRTQARIEWRPLSRAELLGALPERSRKSQAEAKHEQQSWKHWLDYCALHPQRAFDSTADSFLAHSAILFAAEHGKAQAMTGALFGALWEQGGDISDRVTVMALAGELELDSKALEQWLDQPVAAEALRRNCAELIARGGFATPAFFVGDDLFVGNAQMPVVELALAQSSGVTFVMPGSHYWEGEEAL